MANKPANYTQVYFIASEDPLVSQLRPPLLTVLRWHGGRDGAEEVAEHKQSHHIYCEQPWHALFCLTTDGLQVAQR